ncbi:MAG: sulfatase-like hydrolase/transferase, partial [Opitutales bacterium]
MPSKPNLLIIMTDQHRADHAGWDARPRLATPHLNRIAAEARDEPFAGFTPDAETTAALHALRRAYAAMIDGIDEQVGRVLDRLTALGLDNSTMVAFTADHGEMPGATNPGPGRWWRSGSGSM